LLKLGMHLPADLLLLILGGGRKNVHRYQ
jgi:hypothetical protein